MNGETGQHFQHSLVGALTLHRIRTAYSTVWPNSIVVLTLKSVHPRALNLPATTAVNKALTHQWLWGRPKGICLHLPWGFACTIRYRDCLGIQPLIVCRETETGAAGRRSKVWRVRDYLLRMVICSGWVGRLIIIPPVQVRPNPFPVSWRTVVWFLTQIWGTSSLHNYYPTTNYLFNGGCLLWVNWRPFISYLQIVLQVQSPILWRNH